MTAKERERLIKIATSKEFAEMATRTLVNSLNNKRMGESIMEFDKHLHGKRIRNTSGT